MLDIEIGDKFVCAKTTKHIPAIFTREETEDDLSNLKGTYWLVVNEFYGSGLRLLECLRLRVKDIDFNCNQIIAEIAMVKKDGYGIWFF